MKHWTSGQYPIESLDKMSTEDKISISDEYDLWEPRLENWRELAPEERLLIAIFVVDMIPEEQRTPEVHEAINEAIAETERRLCEVR